MNEDTTMGDDDRFVLRRGTQGDEWRVQDGAPPEPEPPKPTGLGRMLSGLGAAGGRVRGWLRSAFGGVAGRLGGKSGEPPEPELPPQAEEPPHGWAPMPLPEDPRVAVPWSKVAPPRPKMPPLDRTGVSRPRVVVPWAKIAFSRSKERTPKPPKVSAPKVLPVVKPERMPKLKAPVLTFNELRRFRFQSVREDMQAPLAVFGGLLLASLLAVGAIVGIEALVGGGGGNGGLVIAVTETPEASASAAPQDTLTDTPTASAELSPTEAPAATQNTTPVASATAAPPTGVPATAAPKPAGPGGVPSASTPQGALAVAYWSNKLNQWWFRDLTDTVANYEEGQDVPFLVSFNGAPNVTYFIHIVYDCQVPDVFGAMDYLSGTQDYGSSLRSAMYGPGAGEPDGAIPVPDTPNFDPDDGDPGIFQLWGAKFPVLPLPPHPDDNCDFQRTLDVPVQGFGGTITFIGSGHLGTATVYSSGEGASTAADPFGLHIRVEGVGAATVLVNPSAVADVER